MDQDMDQDTGRNQLFVAARSCNTRPIFVGIAHLSDYCFGHLSDDVNVVSRDETLCNIVS